MTSPLSEEKTEVGSYFVSNYPPFSFWKRELVKEAEDVLRRPSAAGVELGLYLHIPFCRKRCKFCYFRVYTDKDARDVERYLAALAREMAIYEKQAAVRGRPLSFVYFGGGTPSFISARQLRSLVKQLQRSVSWKNAEEVTFECEPGTLNEKKLEAIREIGVTRLSLGIENFDDEILEENGRAHRSPEVFTVYEQARRIGFDQLNIDLIAGMVGETDANWKDCVRKAIDLDADSVTIYQMELPYNTLYSKQITGMSSPVADWKTKREWVDLAFADLEAAGYHISSAYTLVKDPSTRFAYRDALWRGADLVGTGVASFGHLGGVHYQNLDGFDDYCERIEEGVLPLNRALRITPRQALIRQLILQLKLGRVEARYFQESFGVDILREFEDVLKRHEQDSMLVVRDGVIELTRKGLLRVDGLLEPFFEPLHRGARYT